MPTAIDWDLERFVTAQEPVYAQVCAELATGRKRTHWMWFVFPQLKALGRSATAQFFGLDGAAEATAYWQHPVLGERLRHCTELLLQRPGTDAHAIFGSPDTMKLRSCMTLFEIVAPDAPVFGDVLVRYFNGMRDDATVALVSPA
ncbi:DUF1810 domain-containing protein [Variovorax sp. RO1]|uniref:DUF1810 domain-containing protein n=1 Tax=Variovorax sp. RO1 TaxID=2066034 RepID=UPI000C7180D5|nr:DUF1810 domain-containing protein [Variovorax sp. RO1]PLC05710.1 DUF1810 domain-containing protein [Variovorax sp. RO1]